MTIRILALLILALIAFAGNSLLNRAALAGIGSIDWASFTAIRIISGALFLTLLMAAKHGLKNTLPVRGDLISAAALFLYAAAFSFAYISLGAGLGALLLFASVQITLQAIGISKGIIPSWLQILGLLFAFAGLLIFLAPVLNFDGNIFDGNIFDGNIGASLGYVMMIIAGIAWGIYSWMGRSATDASLSTARNFIGAAPLCILLIPFIMPDSITCYGALLAIISGVITSGLGYVLWYAVLPKISVSLAATAQLSVPAIATIGGILFLDEAITKTFLLGSGLIFTGIGLTIWNNRPNKRKT